MEVRRDRIKPADIALLPSSMAALSHSTMVEVMKRLRRIFNVTISQNMIEREPVTLEIPGRPGRLVRARG